MRRPTAVGIAMFAMLYAAGAALAAAFGELGTYLRDPRWASSQLISALCSVQLVGLTRDVDRIWNGLEPWLATPPDDVARLRREVRPMLARHVVPSALVWVAFTTIWIVKNSWGEAFADRRLPTLLNIIDGAFLAYFLGVTITFNIGAWRMLRRMASTLAFSPELFLAGGSGALKPVRRMFWHAWLFFLVIDKLTSVGTTPLASGTIRVEDLPIWFIVGVVLAIRLSAQAAMTRLIATERQRVLSDLHSRLSEERRAANTGASDTPVASRRVQILIRDVDAVERFSPALIDTRAVVQIALSVAATLIANVMVRTVLDRVLR
jgi:hypothetical protein